MAHSSRVERRREKRQESGAQLRKDRFISDYILHKYNKVHTEAEDFYNALRILYPNKYDLRKTAEFFAWKNQLSNIKTIEAHPQPISTSRELAYTDNLQLEIPLFTRKSKTTTVAAAETHESAIVEPQEQETAIVERQETSIVELQEQETANVERQEQETATTVEIIEEGISPPIPELISPDILQEVIDELTLDPYLKDIFTDFEHLGMDIDINERDIDICELANWQ